MIVLNSEEYQEVGGKGMLGETQIAWLKADLEKSKDAGLTVVALHHPVWANKARNDWPAVEALLAARNAIVFAGHYHEYTYEVRSGIPHVIVGPVAGEQRDPNDTLGRLRHVTLVTVEDGKPYVALVKLGSVLPMDAVHWKTQEYVDETCKASRLDYAPEDAQPGQPVSITWTLNNPLNVAMKIEAAWSKDSAWQVEPATASVVLQPKERKRLPVPGPAAAGWRGRAAGGAGEVLVAGNGRSGNADGLAGPGAAPAGSARRQGHPGGRADRPVLAGDPARRARLRAAVLERAQGLDRPQGPGCADACSRGWCEALPAAGGER